MAVVLEGQIIQQKGDDGREEWIWKGHWRFQGRHARSPFLYKRSGDLEDAGLVELDIPGNEEAVVKEVLESLLGKVSKQDQRRTLPPPIKTEEEETVKNRPKEDGESKDEQKMEKDEKQVQVKVEEKEPPESKDEDAKSTDLIMKIGAKAGGLYHSQLPPGGLPPLPELERLRGRWAGAFTLVDLTAPRAGGGGGDGGAAGGGGGGGGGGRAPPTQEVPESFRLEVAPMPDGERDAAGHKRRGARKKSDRGDVRVTGHGGNQFGVFALSGSYESRARTLALERVYQVTPGAAAPARTEKKRSKKKAPRRDDGAAGGAGAGGLGAEGSPPAWRDGEEAFGFGTEGGVRKSRRSRVGHHPAFLYDFVSDGLKSDSAEKPPSKKKDKRDEGDADYSAVKLSKKERKKSLAAGDGSPAPPSLAAAAAAAPGPKKVGRPKGTGAKAGAKAKAAATEGGALEGAAAAAAGGGGGAWGGGPPLAGGGAPAPAPKKRKMGHPNWRSAHLAPDDSGEVYEGGWLRGRRHYLGCCVYPGGNMYEGEWRNGLEHGKGKLLGPDRSLIFDGYFQEGKIHGRGRYLFPRGDEYDGEWKENHRHGRGRYTTAAGAVYDGEWRDGVRHGRGRMAWPDGAAYDGDWADDLRHGRGVLTLADGFCYDGQWARDLMEGRGAVAHPCGQRYEGSFRGGLKEGRGTLFFANGAQYEGRFRDDKIDGTGTLKITEPVEDVEEGGYLIPIQFQSDMERIHLKAGFDKEGQ